MWQPIFSGYQQRKSQSYTNIGQVNRHDADKTDPNLLCLTDDSQSDLLLSELISAIQLFAAKNRSGRDHQTML